MIQSFLMVGQSNMAGRGFLSEVKPITNERIKMLRNGRWQQMAEPINFDREVSGVGPGASFAEMLCQADEEATIGLIPCAEGGSSIDEWHPEGPLFQHALAQCKLALKDSSLTAILWHQGESDSHSGRYETYFEKLEEVLKAFRTALDAPDLPIMIGGLPPFLGKSGFGLFATEFEKINEVLLNFCQKQPNCYFVTAKDLTANPDGIHIDALSQRYFGMRYYEAFSRKQSLEAVDYNEAEVLKVLESRPLTEKEKMYLRQVDYALGKISYESLING